VTRLAILAVPLLLAACGDPYQRAYTWHPTGVNEANLAAMVRDKRDLVAGHEQAGSDGHLAAAAAERLHDDKTKPLHLESTSSLGGGGGP
jgi:hypothetical protein